MNADVGIWNKLTKAVIFLFFVAIVVIAAERFVPLIKENERYRKEILRLEAQIQKEEETNRKLKSAINALSNDPKTVERLAREQLGYAKPGETVIRFEEPATNTVAPH